MWYFTHERCSRCLDIENWRWVIMEASLDKKIVPKMVCRFLKLTTPFTAPNMRDDVNAILNLGWSLVGIYPIDGSDWAVFQRPKKQI